MLIPFSLIALALVILPWLVAITVARVQRSSALSRWTSADRVRPKRQA